MAKNLAEKYGIRPMERTFHMITPTRHIPRRSAKRFLVLDYSGAVVIWNEKPEGYHHCGFAILQADGEYRSFPVYTPIFRQDVGEMESCFAKSLLRVYGWELWYVNLQD